MSGSQASRPPGGQEGHPGRTLRMSEQPDRISVHQVFRCEHCHRPLEDVPAQGSERRQVFDLPELRLEVTEHRAERKSCPHCGEVSRAPFPPDVTQPAQYGTRVRAVATYLSQYQLLPYERIKELFTDLFEHAISPATVVAANHALANQLAPVEEDTKDQIRQAPVAHFDETGIRVDGRLHWLHAAGTPTETVYVPHPQRGRPALEDMDVLPRLAGTAVHDAWAPYFAYGGHRDALCNAHHLRELTSLVEQGQAWAQEMIDFLLESKQTVEKARIHAGRLESEELERLAKRYTEVLAHGRAETLFRLLPVPPVSAGDPGKRRPKTCSTGWSNTAPVLAFMYYFRVPFDNNLAERDLRMVKVQQKISGTFRSFAGAQAFCRIRGYISTVRKRGYSVLAALEAGFRGQPFLQPLEDP